MKRVLFTSRVVSVGQNCWKITLSTSLLNYKQYIIGIIKTTINILKGNNLVLPPEVH